MTNQGAKRLPRSISGTGEPLWNVTKDLVIFFSLRGRPNTMLNRRLPEITARPVLSIAPFEDRLSARRANRPNTR